MKTNQIINIFDEERPNQIKAETKLRWLKQIELKILKDVVLTHEIPEDVKEKYPDGVTPNNYFESWGMDFDLYIPEEYSDVYVRYLDEKTCQMQNEMNDYNVASALFNNEWLAFVKKYNQENRPLYKPVKFVNHAR